MRAFNKVFLPATVLLISLLVSSSSYAVALTAQRHTKGKSLGRITNYAMAVSTTIYAGSLVCLNSSGLAVPCADTVGFKGCVGVATKSVTSASSGTSNIQAQEGTFNFVATSLTQARNGDLVYIVDDQTVDESVTNFIPAGRVIERVGNTEVWVQVGNYTATARIAYFPIFLTLAGITGNADVLTTWTPGFRGRILALNFYVNGAVASTAGKAATLNLEINTTNLTGGAVALTSANCTPLGVEVAGSAVTAANEFDENDTISLEAASVTAFAEGSGTLMVKYEVY